MSGLLTTKEFAHEVGCSRPTVSGWVAKGLLVPATRQGRVNYFYSHDIERMRTFYNRNRADGGGAAPDRTSAAKEVEEPTGVPFGPVHLEPLQGNTEEGQKCVPKSNPNFVMEPAEAVVLANALKNAEPTWVWGPSGGGKTSGVRQMCAALNWPFYRINMSGHLSVSDFVGQVGVVVDEATGQAVTAFREGVLLQAMRHGGVLLVDEVTAAPPSVLLALQAVLERPSGAIPEGASWCRYVNTENGGEVIDAHPNFRIIVTDNTNGQGDLSGLYSGTNVMNEAFRSRFTQWLYKGYPDRETWVTLLKAETPAIPARVARKIVSIAQDINRGSAALGATTVTNDIALNPRGTLAIARQFLAYDDLSVAFRVAFLASLHPDSQDYRFVLDLLNNKLGTL